MKPYAGWKAKRKFVDKLVYMALRFSDAEENQTGGFNDPVNYHRVGVDIYRAIEKRNITLDATDDEVVEDVLREVKNIRNGGYYDE